jgi:hypothetical protein
MRVVSTLLAGAVVVAGGTLAGGWWTVPAIAALWAASPVRSRPAVVAAAAGLAWAFLLLNPRGLPHLGRLAGRLAAVLGIPLPVLILLVPLYAALLAWSAAALVTVMQGAKGRRA